MSCEWESGWALKARSKEAAESLRCQTMESRAFFQGFKNNTFQKLITSRVIRGSLVWPFQSVFFHPNSQLQEELTTAFSLPKPHLWEEKVPLKRSLRITGVLILRCQEIFVQTGEFSFKSFFVFFFFKILLNSNIFISVQNSKKYRRMFNEKPPSPVFLESPSSTPHRQPVYVSLWRQAACR